MNMWRIALFRTGSSGSYPSVKQILCSLLLSWHSEYSKLWGDLRHFSVTTVRRTETILHARTIKDSSMLLPKLNETFPQLLECALYHALLMFDFISLPPPGFPLVFPFTLSPSLIEASWHPSLTNFPLPDCSEISKGTYLFYVRYLYMFTDWYFFNQQ